MILWLTLSTAKRTGPPGEEICTLHTPDTGSEHLCALQALCCGSPTHPAPVQLPPAQAADRRSCFYSWGWVFPQGHAPPQLQVNREMHPCQLLLCTAVLSCARAPILLLWMGERTKAADVLSEPGEVLASRAASQLPCLLPGAANLPAYRSIWPFPASPQGEGKDHGTGNVRTGLY